MSAKSLRNAYRGRSRFTASGYIDPDGFEYGKATISCAECVFHKRDFSSCSIYEEEGLSKREIKDKKMYAVRDNSCQWFLDDNFDEADEMIEQLKKRR